MKTVITNDAIKRLSHTLTLSHTLYLLFLYLNLALLPTNLPIKKHQTLNGADEVLEPR